MQQTTPPSIPGYDVLRQIGAGGSGTVWAVRREDGMRLAAKVLPQDRADEATWSQAVAHDHLLPILEVVRGACDGQVVTALVMPLAEGGSLADVIGARGHFTAGELVTVLVPVARAVHRLHSLGLVHGDVKPSNVLLTANGRPMLADLGAARLPAQTDGVEVWATELWSAPEVLCGAPPDAASDCYGLGAIAWACATGEAPPPAAMRPRLVDIASQLDGRLCDIITACLSHTPSARPGAAELADLVWAATDAEPAPVGLSAGARTAATTGDPAADLTRRIRARAVAEVLPEAEPPRRLGWLVCRGGRGAGNDDVGAGAASAVQGAADSRRSTPTSRGRHTATEPVRRGRRVALAGCLAAMVTGTGWWLITPDQQGSPAAPRSARESAVAATTRIAVATFADPAGPSSAPTPASSLTPMHSPAPDDAALADPAVLLQSLLASRAQSWNALDTTRLAGVFVVGSAAWQQDSSDLSTVRARRASYQDVRFEVRSAVVTHRSASSAQLSSVVTRAACRLRVAGNARVVPAQTSAVHFDLTRTQEGWRISAWHQEQSDRGDHGPNAGVVQETAVGSTS